MDDRENPVITALAELILARCPEGHDREHPFRVSWYAETDDEVIVALAHDLIEDNFATRDELQALGLTTEQLDAIGFLTRLKAWDGEWLLSYEEYINLIVMGVERNVSGARLAATVKMYDLFDHVHPNSVAGIRPKKVERYGKAITAIGQAISRTEGNHGNAECGAEGEGASCQIAA